MTMISRNADPRGSAGHQLQWNERVRGESAQQAADRQLNELLQELRVAQAGVQILFAFLLVIPFQEGFADVSSGQRLTHVVALLAALVSACLLTAPVAFHRVLFHQRLKPRLVAAAHRVASLGMVFLAISMTGSVLLVLHESLGQVPGLLAAAFSAGLFLVLWLAWPMLLRRPSGEPDDVEG